MKKCWKVTYADENYDYGAYGEAGYDDGSGMIDPNTGMPLQTADGNKGESLQIKHYSCSNSAILRGFNIYFLQKLILV